MFLMLFVFVEVFYDNSKIYYILSECVQWYKMFEMLMHSDWFSCLSKKEFLDFGWLIHNWDIVTCSFLDFLKPSFHFSMLGFIWKNLLCMLLLQSCCCHFLWKNMLILIFRPVYRILNLSGAIFSVDLAAESSLSFPLIPILVGTQQRMVFELYI